MQACLLEYRSATLVEMAHKADGSHEADYGGSRRDSGYANYRRCGCFYQRSAYRYQAELGGPQPTVRLAPRRQLGQLGRGHHTFELKCVRLASLAR